MKATVTRLEAPAHGIVLGLESTRLQPGQAQSAVNAVTRNARFEGIPGGAYLEIQTDVMPIHGLHFRKAPGGQYAERRFAAYGGQLLVDGIPAKMGE